jgi:antitoxin (DNA-binding transcriptional repressor) of toxin-antitoxin stability system
VDGQTAVSYTDLDANLAGLLDRAKDGADLALSNDGAPAHSGPANPTVRGRANPAESRARQAVATLRPRQLERPLTNSPRRIADVSKRPSGWAAGAVNGRQGPMDDCALFECQCSRGDRQSRLASRRN